MPKYCLLFVFLFINSVFAEDFVVQTTPADVDVFVSSSTDGKLIKLGKTPLKMDSNKVFEQTGLDKSFVLTLKKEGFDLYRVLIVKTPKVDYKMSVLMNINQEISTIKKHDLLMSELFKVQGLIRASNFSDAISMLNKLEKDYKDFSVISELKGLAYYMKKDLKSALSMFRLAFSKNSENRDAYKMKVYLEKKFGLSENSNI